MEQLKQYIPFLIPLIAIELGLLIFVIIDVASKKKTKTLTPLIWIAISVVINTIGPVLYIIFGRTEKTYKDDDI